MTVGISGELPFRRDWKMKRGADWGRAIKLREDDGVTVINTTSYSMTMTIRAGANGETYATLTIGSGITNTAAEGLFTLGLSAAAVDALDFATAEYEIQITDAGGGKFVAFVGELVMT